MIKNFLKSIPPVRRFAGLLKFLYFPVRVRKAIREDKASWKPGDSPLPPPKLRYRVHGALDRKSFEAMGAVCANSIRKALKTESLDVYSFHRILDFGCGCGRILLNFKDRPDSCRISGTDIDAELIAWCRENLAPAEFDVNPSSPPMKYKDGEFNFIFGNSVFTHLDEKMQFDWLRELQRISAPGAYLLLSIHGPSLHGHLTAAQKRTLADDGFLFFSTETGAFKLDGLPDFYQSTYHGREYVFREWGRFFKVVRIIERGMAEYQDLVLLKRE